MHTTFRNAVAILTILLIALIFIQRGLARYPSRNQYDKEKVSGQENLNKGYIPSVLHSITEEPTPTKIGHVKGILYSENMSSAIISDKNSIVYEGDSIYGATIVKIYKNKVEFVKNDKRWTQKVGGPPSSEWYK